MRSRQLFGLSGIFLLLIACFFPLAKLNNFIITIFPVWDNLVFEAGLWTWRDISFFAFTMALLIVLSLIFAVKNNYTGLLITSLLIAFVTFIIFITIFQVQSKASVYSNITFKIGWGWLLLIPGTVLLLIAGISKKLNH